MSDPIEYATPTIEAPDGNPAADLPPVEPPTAGFIAQLFLIPALIVGVLVAVYLLFGKIAGGHRSPDEYLKDLRGANEERRWLAAHELALFLQHDSTWQNDHKLANELAADLERSLAGQQGDDRTIQYQKYLASALGAFNSESGIDALNAALDPEASTEVRLAAIWSCARLGDRLQSNGDATPLRRAVPGLTAAAGDDDNEVRKLTAYALGCLGIPDATAPLLSLLADADREVRYNAASALARLGSDAGFDTLEEMLTPELLRRKLTDSGLNPTQIENQMTAVPLAAIESLSKFLQQSSRSSVAGLESALKTLAETGPPLVRTRSKELVIRLDSTNENG
jgi:HEAT repeat protein